MSLFQKRSGPFPEPTVSPFPGVSAFGGANSDHALKIAAVWASVRLLADAVSMMPVNGYTFRDGQRVPLSSPPQLLVQPAYRSTVQDWVYAVMVSLLLKGNAYGRVTQRDGNGVATQIDLVDASFVEVSQDHASGQVVYKFHGGVVPTLDVFHVRAFTVPGHIKGLSPVGYAAATLGSVHSAEEFGREFFTDGAHPSSILTTDASINQDQAKTIKERFLAAVSGREPAVLGAGIKWQSVQVSPEESQFLETQRFGVNQIARFFGVPPEMIGGSPEGNMTYTNVTQRAMDFLTYSVQPWLTRLESALSAQLPNVRHVMFDTSVLVRLDAVAKWQVNEARVNTGAAIINELRAEDGNSPVDWGKEPFLPGIKTPAAAAAIKAAAETKAAVAPEEVPSGQ